MSCDHRYSTAALGTSATLLATGQPIVLCARPKRGKSAHEKTRRLVHTTYQDTPSCRQKTYSNSSNAKKARPTTTLKSDKPQSLPKPSKFRNITHTRRARSPPCASLPHANRLCQLLATSRKALRKPSRILAQNNVCQAARCTLQPRALP